MTGEGTFIAHLLHLEGFWGFVIVNAPPVKEEPEAGHWDAHLRQDVLLPVPHLMGRQHDCTSLL